MDIRQELEQELEETRLRFTALVESIPDPDLSLPSGNPAWTVGDLLFHITLGPRALALEIWMIIHARRVYQLVTRFFPTRAFNAVNAWFGRQGRTSPQALIRAYGQAHAAITSQLKRVRVEDLSKSVVYPDNFISDLTGEVTVERLFRYVKGHFEEHERAIRTRSE